MKKRGRVQRLTLTGIFSRAFHSIRLEETKQKKLIQGENLFPQYLSVV